MPQPLASKERTLFSQVVKNYENKQYKKGVKAADQILKKNPNHGDTQAMKALILNSQQHGDEAFALAKEALKNDMKSHVCWHVYGLLYRSVKNFEESIKAYKFALRLEPDSQQIARDLALLQMQMRDYPGYVQSRRSMLQARPTVRSNWTALAIAQHLSGDVDGAEKTLTAYDESLRTQPPKTDIEHQEAALYKNSLIAEMGQTEKALEHLDAVSKYSYDKQSVMEMRAGYLLKLERKDEAEKVYRTLLDRNSDNRAYYAGLIEVLGIQPSDTKALHEMYSQYAEKSPRADTPRRVPLDFLEGDEFRAAADKYLQRMLNKGVPSTFANIKALYSDKSKQATIQDLAEGYAAGKVAPQSNGNTEGKEDGKPSQFETATLYFLAQHYDYYKSRDLGKAMELIEKAIALKPDSVDFNMTKARILKHQADIQGAAEQMEKSRALDERDRYINTKAAKYQLRNDENEAALKNMGKFTRQDAVGGPLGDLIDMQCMWFLSEDGESYLRQNNIALALKRFTSVFNIFDVWQEDQFDFHSFSIRKGQIRAYVDLIRFEDRLREHPFYTRAGVGAIKAYILLHDHPELASGALANGANGQSQDASAQKKAAKKARKEKEKQEQLEAEKKDAKKTAGVDPNGDPKKEDKDPLGKQLLATTTPLEEAMKFLTPMLELSPKDLSAQKAGFELYLRRHKLAPALRCLLAQKSLGAPAPSLHSQALRLGLALTSTPTPLPPAVGVPLQQSLDPFLPSKPTGAADLAKLNEGFLAENEGEPEAVFAYWEVRLVLEKGGKEGEGKEGKEGALGALVDVVGSEKAGVEDGLMAVGLARDWALDGSKVVEKAKKRWPEVTSFREGRA